MYLGRVIGSVWSTMKDARLTGHRLVVVQPLTPELAETGRKLVCADTTGAGVGEVIYWCRGKESSFPFLPVEVPVDTTIVGIVDTVHLNRAANSDTVAVVAETPATPPAKPVRARSRKG
jgi:ethanolamine utilization protein EutN